MTQVCPKCGAKSVEGMEGGEYTSHMSDCPYRRTWGSPRRTMRDRGAQLIADARWELSRVNWWLVLGVIALAVIVGGLMILGFEWWESWERGG